MGRKHYLQPHQSIVDGDMSGDITSDETVVNQLDSIQIEIEWSGTSPVGEIFVETASDKPLLNNQKTEWKALDFGNQILVSGNSGNHLINLREVPFGRVRVRYAATSGVGTLNAWISGKSVAA